MKKMLLLVFFTLSTLVFCQNLTLSELISLRKMSLEEAETYLTKKGWQYKGGTEAEVEKLGKAEFVYNASDDLKYGHSFIHLLYMQEQVKRIAIQTSEMLRYTEYLDGVNKFAASPKNTKIVEGDLVKIFIGPTTTFAFTTTTLNNSSGSTKTSWLLLIAENEDYNTAFGFD